MDENEFNDILHQLGYDLVNRIMTILSLKDKVATGELISSFEYSVETGRGGDFLKILAENHWWYVDQGRKPGGKMPPEAPIRDWMAVRGIPDSALWPIRRKIAIEGFKGIEFVKEAVEYIEKQFKTQLEDKLQDKYSIELFKQLKNIMVNK